MSLRERYIQKQKQKASIECGGTRAFLHPGMNACGPGNETTDEYWSKYTPVNGSDSCCKTHDLEYGKIFKISDPNERQKKIRESDLKLLDCLDKEPPDELGNKASRIGIQTKNKGEDVIGKNIGKYLGNYFGSN